MDEYKTIDGFKTWQLLIFLTINMVLSILMYSKYIQYILYTKASDHVADNKEEQINQLKQMKS